jgi:outer membrane receptor protein involved in Fe transport
MALIHPLTRWTLFILLVVLATALGAASPARAQFVATASIEGSVTDESGGALPGVTVTASSPALQVGQVTAVTDPDGRYRLVQLPLGVYQVKYELSGFQSMIREGLQLSTGFAAKVDIVLKVGAVSETVTVSGASPIVDVKTTTSGQLLSAAQVNDLLPTARMYGDMSRMIPGMVTTSAPNIGSLGLGSSGSFSVYGSTGQNILVDGLEIRSNTYPDFSSAEEVDIKTFANGADITTPGAVWNIVTKSGGNQFHGRYAEQYINKAFQSSNIDDTIRAQGLSIADSVRYFSDWNSDLGGKIVKDKLWFYGNFRDRENRRAVAGLASAPGPDGIYGTGDEPPYYPIVYTRNYTGKLSYQPTPRYQFVAFYAEDYTVNDADLLTARAAQRFIPYEAATYETYNPTNWRGEFRATIRDNMLFNAQSGRVSYVVNYKDTPGSETIPARWDRNTGIFTGGSVDGAGSNYGETTRPRVRWVEQGNLTYLPHTLLGGGHEFKIGYRVWIMQGASNVPNHAAGNYQLTYDVVGGIPHQPVEIQVFNAPITQVNRENSYSGYLNDKWAVGRRLTLNLGVRYDYDHSFVPEQTKVQGQFGGAGTFPRFEGNTWKDWSPRFGLAFDLTGDAKTVIKTTFGTYGGVMEDTFASPFNKNGAVVTTYHWHDLNGNSNYDPGEVNLDTNGTDFISITGAANNVFNPNLKRPQEREFTTSFDRELVANTSFRAAYVYKRMARTIETVNILRPFGAYDLARTVIDPGPDGVVGTADDGGPVTIYDYEAAYRGSNFVGNEMQNRPSDRDDYYQTVEFTLRRRTTEKWGLVTSFSTTKNHRYLVGIPQSPNDLFFPLDETWIWVYKVNGSYRLPYGFIASGLFDVLPGLPGQRTNIFRGLPQSSTVTIRLEPYGAHNGLVRPTLNVRLAKQVKLGKGQFLASIDALNALNSNAFWGLTFASGPTFGYGTIFTNPRALQFSATYQF